jgi:hypothetical protein
MPPSPYLHLPHIQTSEAPLTPFFRSPQPDLPAVSGLGTLTSRGAMASYSDASACFAMFCCNLKEASWQCLGDSDALEVQRRKPRSNSTTQFAVK